MVKVTGRLKGDKRIPAQDGGPESEQLRKTIEIWQSAFPLTTLRKNTEDS